MKKVYSKHHVVPTSRNKDSKKVTELPKLFHASWHVLFENLYDKEIEVFIRIINDRMKKQEVITAKELSALKQKIKKGDFNDNL